VYCERLQDLVELFGELRDGTARAGELEDGKDFAAVQLELGECFFREIQVLPNRTHPAVGMNPFGGYLLSGFKVEG
jgi:hypothetical protein